MIGRIDRDVDAENECRDHRRGMKFPSYKEGLEAGKRDFRGLKNLEHKELNPYSLTPEILSLLKKRARWESGYQTGWMLAKERRKLIKKKKK